MDTSDGSNLVLQEMSSDGLATALVLGWRSDRAKGRLFLAAVAIVNLGCTTLTKSPVTRQQLFVAPNNRLMSLPCVSKEYAAKAWQNDFIMMLVTSGCCRVVQLESGAKAYLGDDIVLLSRFNRALIAGDFDFLKLLLWPAQYGAPSAKDFKEAEKQAEEAPSSDPAAVEQEGPAVDIIEKVALNLKGVADHLGELYNQVKEQSSITKDLNTNFVLLVEEASSKFSAVVSRLDTIAQTLEKVSVERAREDREDLRDVMTRLVESDVRKRSLINQLEGESRKVEALLKIMEEKGVSVGK